MNVKSLDQLTQSSQGEILLGVWGDHDEVHTVQTSAPTQFHPGTNDLLLRVVNNPSPPFAWQEGGFPRGGPGDCMCIEIDGSVSFVPEPGSLVTLAAVGLFVAVRRRRAA